MSRFKTALLVTLVTMAQLARADHEDREYRGSKKPTKYHHWQIVLMAVGSLLLCLVWSYFQCKRNACCCCCPNQPGKKWKAEVRGCESIFWTEVDKGAEKAKNNPTVRKVDNMVDEAVLAEMEGRPVDLEDSKKQMNYEFYDPSSAPQFQQIPNATTNNTQFQFN